MCSRKEAAWLRREPGKLLPFGRTDEQLCARQDGYATNVVLVQVGEDRRVNVGDRIPKHRELALESVARTDVKLGQAVVDDSGESAGKV